MGVTYAEVNPPSTLRSVPCIRVKVSLGHPAEETYGHVTALIRGHWFDVSLVRSANSGRKMITHGKELLLQSR